MEEVMAYINENSERFIQDLRRLCQQPSISAQNKGIRDCAELLRDMIKQTGIETKVIPIKGGFPIVFGEISSKKEVSTLGFYNHYDVQPPDPIEEWISPPFTPEIRGGKMFARGVVDNKGNIMARLKAVEAVLKVTGEVPINLKFLIDGEEEIGSPHLGSFVKENRDLLKADGYIWEGGQKDEKDQPVIFLGVKGLLYIELRARGAHSDQHSSMAPLVPNPAWRLVWALGSMKGPDEKIMIDGWYDDIEQPTMKEVELLKNIPFEENKMKERLGIKEFLGNVKGLDAIRNYLYAPTCTICGFDSGYRGTGSKTVLPSKGTAKVGFRLVRAQSPEKLFTRIKEHLRKHGFGDIDVEKLSSLEPSKTPVDDPLAKLTINKAREIYGVEPVVLPTHAGSSPVYIMKNWLNIPCIFTGVGYAGSNVHSPNENIRIDDYIQGIKHIASIIMSYRRS